MQRVDPIHASVTTPGLTQSVCCSPITKIALAVLASLAAFVFLPPGIAFTFSAIVTIGAAVIGYNGSNAPIEAPASPSQSIPLPKRVQVNFPGAVILEYANHKDKQALLDKLPDGFSNRFQFKASYANPAVIIWSNSARECVALQQELSAIYGPDLKFTYSTPHIAPVDPVREPKGPKPIRIWGYPEGLDVAFESEDKLEEFMRTGGHEALSSYKMSMENNVLHVLYNDPNDRYDTYGAMKGIKLYCGDTLEGIDVELGRSR